MTTAVADVKAGTVRATVEIAAPPAAVFRALTDPQELETWWGHPEMYRTHDYQIDLRVGGKWSAKATGGGQESVVRGEYLAVDPPRVLETSWEPSWDQFRRTIVRYTLEAIPSGTRLTVFHRGFAGEEDCKNHADGWERVLEWLTGYLARIKKATV